MLWYLVGGFVAGTAAGLFVGIEWTRRNISDSLSEFAFDVKMEAKEFRRDLRKELKELSDNVKKQN
jgi:hypothetical protein